MQMSQTGGKKRLTTVEMLEGALMLQGWQTQLLQFALHQARQTKQQAGRRGKIKPARVNGDR